ncbi:MAG TPA: glycoside hydrolase family 13 [bacterium]|nr:glycoside hydrolase family 13 [bacterium]
MIPVLRRPLEQVIFRFDGRRAPDARSIALVGTFNRWDSAAHPLRRDPDGWWTIAVWLSPGEYEYLFLVDGVPWNDPLDDGRRASEWGGHNSLRVV